MKKILYSANAPEPIGPYSQATEYGELIYTSGQVALDLDGKLVSQDIKEQTMKAIENLKCILEENNSSLKNVIKTTVFLLDMKDFTDMNGVYNEYFKDSLPSRSTVAVVGLPKDARVEIEVIAYKLK